MQFRFKGISTLALCAIAISSFARFSFAEELSEGLKKLLAPNASLKLITDKCVFTEGPAADSSGRVFFTDQPNNRIMMIDLKGNVSVFTDQAGRSNGMYFDADWTLFTCADEKNEIWKFRSNGTHDVVLGDPDGKKLNGPNDLWISADQVIYFTDPFYKRDWWDHDKAPREVRGLYQVQADGSELMLLDGNFKQPNGIVGDPKNNLLYVADIDDTKIYSYPIKEDGSLGERKLFCEEKSDGMTVDNQGNVYLTNNKGVCVYDKSGKSLGAIPTGKGWTANVCFGGKNNKTLFITASDSVFSIDMSVSGIR